MTKRCYVTSDMHMADGGPLEDFLDDELFRTWVMSIADGDTTLVLNGDIIDFAQIPPLDIADSVPSHLLWTEDVSLIKLRAAMVAHVPFYDGLASFHQAGGTIVFVVGNHDLDWAWPKVHAAIAEHVGAAALGDGNYERLRFELVETQFANVLIEHGHRFTQENAPDDAESFIHEGPDGQLYLERIWGTDFVLKFFNPLHEDLRFAANIKPTWQLALQGVKNGWLGWKHLIRITAFLARQGLPVRAIADVVLSEEDEDVVPDLSRLADRFDDPEVADLVRQIIADIDPDELRAEGLDLLDPDLARNLLPENTGTIGVRATDVAAGGVEAGGDVESQATDQASLGLFSESRLVVAAKEHIARDGIDHVVFGHTHVIVNGLEVSPGSKMFNPGTWIPYIDVSLPEVQAARGGGEFNKELLNDLQYYRRDLCAVEIIEGQEPTVINLQELGL